MIERIEIVSFWQEMYHDDRSVSNSLTLTAESARGVGGEEIAELIRHVRSLTPIRSKITVDGEEIVSC